MRNPKDRAGALTHYGLRITDYGLRIRRMLSSAEVRGKMREIRLLAMDVDGVLTDGALLLSREGEEAKRFHVADGLGIALAQCAGLRIAWISGRRSGAVERRARELDVAVLRQ